MPKSSGSSDVLDVAVYLIVPYLICTSLHLKTSYGMPIFFFVQCKNKYKITEIYMSFNIFLSLKIQLKKHKNMFLKDNI